MEPLMPINQARTPLKRRQLLCQGLLSLSHAVGFIAGLLLCCAATMAGLRGASIMPSHSGTHSAIESGSLQLQLAQTDRQLVLYVFSNTDPEYYANLLYFVKHGIPGCESCDYIIVINQSPTEEAVDLPELPANAKYMHHPNQCYDWGTFGWVFMTEGIAPSSYKYFIFLNSSVRGPFLPTYLKGKVHFTQLMTSKLIDDVKLVGPTISCGGTIRDGEVRQNPHVQSYAMATDSVGLEVLMNDGAVFACYEDFANTIWYSELGSAAVMLEAGYNLDSFQVRYQGVDWRDRGLWLCNEQRNPYEYILEDPIALAPMEVMFVKVKAGFVERRVSSALAATSYDHALNQTASGTRDLQRAPVIEQLWDLRVPRILEKVAYGLDCFDCQFYREHYEDVFPMTCWDAFVHFINYGQFENRVHRYTCSTELVGKVVPYTPTHDKHGWPHFVSQGCSNIVHEMSQNSAAAQAGGGEIDEAANTG